MTAGSTQVLKLFLCQQSNLDFDAGRILQRVLR